jgi:hypothetical protein
MRRKREGVSVSETTMSERQRRERLMAEARDDAGKGKVTGRG